MSSDDELPPVRGVPTSLRGPRSLESQEKLTGPGPGPSVRPSLEASAALGQPSDGTLTNQARDSPPPQPGSDCPVYSAVPVHSCFI
jgi:hypothetical protein